MCVCTYINVLMYVCVDSWTCVRMHINAHVQAHMHLYIKAETHSAHLLLKPDIGINFSIRFVDKDKRLHFFNVFILLSNFSIKGIWQIKLTSSSSFIIFPVPVRKKNKKKKVVLKGNYIFFFFFCFFSRCFKYSLFFCLFFYCSIFFFTIFLLPVFYALR